MVLHATYRQLALRLAEAGFPVLRIDYPGTCDSEGHPRDSARVEAWLSCLDSGADHLRRWSSARELVAFGTLLGGTLATLLASRRDDLAGLVLWGAYAQGRAKLRSELAATATRSARSGSTGTAAGDTEALGFLMTAGMAADLRAIDLAHVRPRRVRSALILSRASGVADRKLAEQLGAQGIDTNYREAAPDLLDAVLHENGAGCPIATIGSIVDWLGVKFPDVQAERIPGEPGIGAPQAVFSEGDTAIRESAIFLGDEAQIFGIVCEPSEPRALDTAVLLVNGGHNHRSGINRNYTEWARRLARAGHLVLRMDLRGLGDSPPARPEQSGRIYTEEGTLDVLEAVAWLRKRGAKQVCCVGLCAGGYQAFQAALRDPAAIASIVMLNPLRFHADRADSSLGFAARIARRLPPVLRAWGSAERRLTRSLILLAKHRVDVFIVYNANETYRAFLDAAVHPVRETLESSGSFRTQVVGPSDHIFSPLWAQQEVAQVLERYVAGLAGARRGAPRRPSPVDLPLQ